MTSRPATHVAVIVALAGFLFCGFVALGTWQLQRRAWKLDLIGRVEHKLKAEAIAPPSRAHWATVGKADEYTRVCVDGTFEHARETQTQAVTERGPGFWVLTPLKQVSGDIVLVNRGFVPPDRRDAATRGGGQVTGIVHVCGLLRLSEPGGGFLRRNDPANARWYSRDVAAMAVAQNLPIADVAPYFVDADATPNPGGWPLGGLTVVRFRNSHLSYALTWYALAVLTLVGAALVVRHDRRSQGRV